MLAELSPLVVDVLGASTCTKQLLSDSLGGALTCVISPQGGLALSSVDETHRPVVLSENAGAPVEGLPLAESRPFHASDKLPKWRPSLQPDRVEFHSVRFHPSDGNAVAVAWKL